jgi:flagellar basal body-associated protein FliL
MTAVVSNVRLILLVVVGALVGVLGGYVAQSKLISGSPPAVEPATQIAAPAARLYLGPDYRLKDRVFNLQDPNGRRYAKIAISLQFAWPTDKYEKMVGDAFLKGSTEFEKDLEPEKDFIDDTLTRVVSSKSMADVLTDDGKAQLKQQIMSELNKGLSREHQVARIFFRDFVIQ